MNSLYIGLGGAGIASVATYSKMAHDSKVGRNDEFLYLDTDMSIRERYPIVGNDFILLGNGRWSIDRLVKEEQSRLIDPETGVFGKRAARQFLKWFDQSPYNMRGEPIDKGTDGNRTHARAMLYFSYYHVKQAILSRLPYRDKDGDYQYRKVFVISGSCGGTGSGIVLDILFLLNEIVQENRLYGHCPFDLLLVMPQGFIVQALPNNVEKLQLNAYACIDELNACLKGRYSNGDNGSLQMNKYKCCDGSLQPILFGVCADAFLFDSVSKNGKDALNMSQISGNIASFLLANEWVCMNYYWLNTIYRDLDYKRCQSDKEPYIKGFAITGMCIIQTWEELIRKYVHDKFIYQMLKYGFVGEKNPNIDYVEASLDDMVFRSKVDDIIKKMDNDWLEKKLDDCDIDKLEEIIKRIKEASVDASCSIVFGYKREFREILSFIREKVYFSCAEWVKKYSINHALMLVERLRGWARNRKLSLAEEIYKAETGKGKEKLRKDCESIFKRYVAFVVCRNLSEDYFAHCEENLLAAIKQIDISTYVLDGKKVADWELDFVQFVRCLKEDDTRFVWPSLDILIDVTIDKLHDSGKIELERYYAEFVTPSDDGQTPKLHYNLDNDKLLYTHKQKCIESLFKEDKSVALFDMDCDAAHYAMKISSAFDTFANEVKKQSGEFLETAGLSVPFEHVYAHLSTNEKGEIRTILNSPVRLSFSTSCSYYYHLSRREVVIGERVGDLCNMFDTHCVESSLMPDRIVKVVAESAYALNDYRYYDSYKKAFERYLQIPENDQQYQPFIDKRFLTNRQKGESLADMFLRESEQDRRISESDKD